MRRLGLLYSLIHYSLAYKQYSSTDLQSFSKYSPSLDLLDINDGALLTPLLVPRVSGTEGATAVSKWIHTYLSSNLTGWRVEEDRFKARTPLGETEFVNIIATMDPPNTDENEVGRLVLAAHYDSLRLPPGFIGATDSSVPCAILLYIATLISERLPFFFEEQYWEKVEDELDAPRPRGIQLIFFDGEEAVVEWSDEDSIYGARNLAERWEREMLAPSATISRKSKIQSIDLMVLLDLLGAESTTIHSYFSTTHWAYEKLADIEKTLMQSQLLKSQSEQPVFSSDSSRQLFHYAGQIGDDHIPFMQRGVEILHVIPLPFPSVWHSMNDDAGHLHQASIDDLATIFSAFAAEYMDMPAKTGLESNKQRRSFDEL